MATTVQVPDEFAALFDAAEKTVSAYFSKKREVPGQGHIAIDDQRYILVRANSLSVDFYAMMKSLFVGQEAKAMQVGRNLLFHLSHFIGRSDAAVFHKKLGLVDPIEKLSAGPVHFSHSGWAFVDILPESNPVPDEDYFLVYDHPYSFESDSWLKAGQHSDHPVCFMNAGYSSGWCEESFGIPLVATEILCVAQGDPYCRFIMGHPSRIESLVEDYLGNHPGIAAQVKGYVVPGEFESVQLQAKLHLTEERLTTLFESAFDAILTIEDGRIAHVNRRATELLGRFRGELRGRQPARISPAVQADGVDSEKAFDFRMANAQAGKPQLFPWRFRRLGGELVETEISLCRVGSTSTLQAIVRDVTARMKAEKERLELEHEMRQLQKMEALGNLAGGVAHDFNNLLAAVGGNLNLIESQVSNEPKVQTSLKDAQQALNRAAKVVRQLLTFARKSQDVEQTVDLAQLVMETAGLFRETIDRRITVSTKVGQVPSMVAGDPTHLSQVVVNLLLNARDALVESLNAKALVDQPEIEITTQVVDRRNPTDSQVSSANYVELTVRDNGAGMSPETQSRAFEPFFTTKGLGSGLGLSTVYGITRQRRGWLETSSELGKGTEIRVYLPLTDKPKQPPVEEIAPSVGAKKDAVILVVEDESSLRRLYENILQLDGYTVLLAADGLAGLDEYQRARDTIDLVLLDLTMPRMMGKDVLEHIVKDNPDMCVIAMSGYATEGNAEEVLATGATAFLPKPFTASRLLALVRTVLSRESKTPVE